MGKLINLTGQKFTMLTVEERVGTRGGSAVWRCKCDCGEYKDAKAGDLKSGNTRSCGCLFKFKPGEAARKKILRTYKHNAKLRGLSFSLTDDEFKSLTNSNCHYCGTEPKTIQRVSKGNGSAVYNGIDRVDNSKGYEINNCVSCCKTCNRAKREMDYKEFIDWCKALGENINKIIN